jgi:DNA invertase Pin-like site-specific DNA recombinase
MTANKSEIGQFYLFDALGKIAVLDLQRDALLAAGIGAEHVYEDLASGSLDARPGQTACLKASRKGDRLLVWKLDRMGRNSLLWTTAL